MAFSRGGKVFWFIMVVIWLEKKYTTREFIPGWRGILLAKKFNSRLEVLQGAKVIAMQIDWLDNLYRLPLTLLILIHHSEMEEKINYSKEQLLWLSHFHEWNQSAMWFNWILSIFFSLKHIKHILDYKITCICVNYSLHRLILGPRILSLLKQNVSHCLCVYSSINKDPLCCRFASVGMTPKTQLYSVWKRGLFWAINPAMAMWSLAQFTLFLDLGLYPALCFVLLEWNS